MHGREALRKQHGQENRNEGQVQEGPERFGGESGLARVGTCPLRHDIIKRSEIPRQRRSYYVPEKA